MNKYTNVEMHNVEEQKKHEIKKSSVIRNICRVLIKAINEKELKN